MKAYKLLSLLLVVLALSSCKDELENGVAGKPGYLTFDLSGTQGWEDGATRSGVEAPIEMECTLEGNPIYLHTEVQATPSAVDAEAPATRGQRYTEDVFTLSSGSSKISSFGVYGRTEGGLTLFNFAEITPTTTETKDAGVAYDWNVKEDDTMFAEWASGTADFYGYAPYFNNTGNANGLTMELNGSYEPVLTYEVPADVTKQLDILTAKHLNLSKSSSGTVVKLPFDHVMSAIKFKFHTGKAVSETSKTGYTLENGVYTKAKDDGDYTWSDGANTYSITVNAVHINNVYSKGSWTVGDDPYNGGRWTVDPEDSGKAVFSYTHDEDLSSATGTEKELNPDDDPHVFMMLPQEVPADATISLDCTFTNTDPTKSTDVKTATLTAALKKWNYDSEGNSTTQESTPMEWLPGFTYTYSISMSDFVYVFDFDTAQDYDVETPSPNASSTDDLTYTNVSFDGYDSYPLMIRSYRIDSKGVKQEVDWTVYHEETVAEGDVESAAGATIKTVRTPGLPDWMVLYEGANDTKGSEVTETTHAGALAGAEARKFLMQIRSIEYPVIDLSLYGFDQTTKRNVDPLKARYTANCYIVSGPGSYRIPLVYGNAISKGENNQKAYLSDAVIANPSLDTSTDINAGVRYLNRLTNHAGTSIGSPYINKVTSGLVKNGTPVLVWEETENLIQDLALDFTHVGEDGYNSDKNEGYLTFTVKPGVFNYGNAVVGVRGSDGNICWSWHIWMTDPSTFTTTSTVDIKNDHKATFAGCNLGWVDEQSEKAPLSRNAKIIFLQSETNDSLKLDATQLRSNAFTPYLTNTLYQWGRKDPMRGVVKASDIGTNDGARRASTGSIPYKNAYREEGTVPISEMIKNPNTIYGVRRGDLYTRSYYNLWGMKCTKTKLTYSFFGKTIYDPCPVGYCVPPSKSFSKLTKRNFNEVSSVADGDYAKCTYTDALGTVVFPVAGIRSSDGTFQMKASGFWSGSHATAYYQSASPYSADENWGMRLDLYGGLVIDTHVGNFKPDHSSAGAVRPVVYKGEQDQSENEDVYIDLPLTFKVTAGSGTISWKNWAYSTGKKYITYVKNGGEPKTVQSDDAAAEISVETDDVLEFYMYEDYDDGVAYGLNSTSYNYFEMSGTGLKVEAYGNIMSLVSDDYETWDIIPTDYAFSNLFNSCSALTSVENLRLPAMTLKTKCYNEMFKNCTGITKAPILPATQLVSGCYDGMFNGCTNLNWVNAQFLDSPARKPHAVWHYDYTDNWLNGVAAAGTFVRNSSATWQDAEIPRNANTVPSGWSITTPE
ncbi:MAG: fimbrillin family protein [Prevotella sp.]|nr:fimbrillin family protein [Prevotella sp.]